ncbi:MAG: hypothetical protein NC213_02750 [Acetobacter sp.]|nr:hypothetical protein [Bacteroides sp.]MCM1340640.1 hypothetical protein [Acetobacter sp.]MCM1433751.1 hypothetical protein [Clostridiales bacterium]
MTKKTKGIIIAVVAVIVAAAIGCGVYFGVIKPQSESAADVAVVDGELYRTKTETFWAGLGKAYISFQHKATPEKSITGETDLSGDVFYVMASAQGRDFEPWLDGTFALDEEAGTLKLTGYWDPNNENSTTLTDAEVGVEKLYNAENGEYKIGVDFTGVGTIWFTLNPATDKVGENTPPATVEETPAEQETPAEANTGNLLARLMAKDTVNSYGTDFTCEAKLDIAKDNIWKMYVMVAGYYDDYTEAASGTWTENADKSLVLKVLTQVAANSLPDTINIACDFSDPNKPFYSGTVKFDSYLTFTLNFKSVDISSTETTSVSKKSNSSNKTNSSTPAPAAAKGELYRTPVINGLYSGIVGSAYMSFKDVDTKDADTDLKGKVFAAYVNANSDGYGMWFAGYWELNSDNTKLTLTMKLGGDDSGLDNAKVDVAKTYTADKDGIFHIPAHFAGGGTGTFTFKPSRDKIGGNSSNSGNSVTPTPTPAPTPTPTPAPETPEGDLKVRLTAQDTVNSYGTDITCYAKLDIARDKTWKMYVMVPGSFDDYTEAASGSWKENSDKSLTLNVTKQIVEKSLANTIKVNCDASGKYTATVKFTSYFTFTLNFSSTATIPDKPNPPVTPVNPDPPVVENKGEIYRTEVYSGIYSGVVGKGYISFKDITEPNEWGKKGKVFEIYVAQSGDNYTMWADGYWSMSADQKELSLTMTEVADTALDDVQANVAKVYTVNEKGQFIIPAHFAGGGTATFVLNVSGSGQNPEEPVKPVDPEPVKPEVQLALAATDTIEFYGTEYTCNAKLDLYNDGTWAMQVQVPGMFEDYTDAASGTWTLNDDYSMTMKVEKQTVENSLPETFKVNCDISGYPNLAYNGEAAFNTGYFAFNLNFTDSAQTTPDPEPVKPEIQLTLTATDTIEFYGAEYTCNSKLDLYNDGTWAMQVQVPGMFDDYIDAANGTWTLNDDYSMTMKVENQTLENSLPETFKVNCDISGYPNLAYNGEVAFNTGYFAFNLKYSNEE